MWGRIDKMHDIDGVEVKAGDFVQLTQGKEPYINGAMKKGFVFLVSHMENRPLSKNEHFPVAFLTDKKNSGRIYQSGCRPSEIRKVNYDTKKRKIIN